MYRNQIFLSLLSYIPFIGILWAYQSKKIAFDLSIVLLLSGLFVFLTLRDVIASWYYRRVTDDSRQTLFQYISRISKLRTEKQIFSLIKIIQSDLGLKKCYLAFFLPEPKLIMFKSAQLKQLKLEKAYEFLRKFQAKLKSSGQSDREFRWLSYKRFQVLILYYRMQPVGFFQIKSVDKPLIAQLLEVLAGKVSLFIETEQTNSSRKNLAEYNREIMVAQKVQNYLVKKKPQKLNNFMLKLFEQSWDRKYFPSIFETASGAGEEKFAILVKFSPGSKRFEPLNLFSVQGHFLGLAPDADSLTSLMLQLQKVLMKQEKEKIQLEGYVIALTNNKLRYCWFGDNLRLSVDSRQRSLRPCAPLGDKSFHLSTTTIYRFTRIDFYLRDIPMVCLNTLGGNSTV